MGPIPAGGMNVLSVVYCQVEVCATSRRLVQKSATECGVNVVCDLET